MSESRRGDWFEENQRYLSRAVEHVRTALERHVAIGDPEARSSPGPPDEELPPPPPDLDPPPALEALSRALALSPFDRQVLVLCAAVELEGAFPALCARAQGDPGRPYPTFGLALAALPGANWAALSPGAPLRYWQLVEIGPGGAMTASQLRIDEPILHFLTGVRAPDERLQGLSETVAPAGDLVPSHSALADELATVWKRTAGTAQFPVLQLCGREGATKRAVAAGVCARLGLELQRAPAPVLPTAPTDLQKLTRLWNRGALLLSTALLLDCDEAGPGDPARDAAIRQVVDGYRGPLFLTSRRRRPDVERSALAIDVGKPRRAEQRAVWGALLSGVSPPPGDRVEGAEGSSPDRRLDERADASLNGQLDRLVAQFDLGVPTIRAAFAWAVGRAERGERDGAAPEGLGSILWQSCRTQARPQLEGLAERIRRTATWDELVLPAERLQVLHEIVLQVRQRVRVYEEWGFAARSARGLGISALFAGTSGTGKTMAAEVLANELDLDLYRVDLSSVVSKYIGETEKNLARIFDAAEGGGAILLFDEADALFGKRTEIRDSHDRYANVEVSYLLQRMESFRGLAILTTNMREALDLAFLRRLRFVVEFPFPGEPERAEIWRRIFPSETPTEGLDVTKLARLNATGGNIRNIALQAAFLAAEDGRAVAMKDLLRAARSEFLKMQKPLPEKAVSDWS